MQLHRAVILSDWEFSGLQVLTSLETAAVSCQTDCFGCCSCYSCWCCCGCCIWGFPICDCCCTSWDNWVFKDIEFWCNWGEANCYYKRTSDCLWRRKEGEPGPVIDGICFNHCCCKREFCIIPGCPFWASPDNWGFINAWEDVLAKLWTCSF